MRFPSAERRKSVSFSWHGIGDGPSRSWHRREAAARRRSACSRFIGRSAAVAPPRSPRRGSGVGNIEAAACWAYWSRCPCPPRSCTPGSPGPVRPAGGELEPHDAGNDDAQPERRAPWPSLRQTLRVKTIMRVGCGSAQLRAVQGCSEWVAGPSQLPPGRGPEVPFVPGTW